MNQELSDVQTGFRRARGTRDQIANICWIIKKAGEFQRNICFIDYAKAFDCVDHNKTVENSDRDGNTSLPDLPLEKSVCRSGSKSSNWTWNNRLVPNRKRSSQGCILSPCLFNLYSEYIMRNAELEETQAGIKIPGEISITSDMQKTPLLWQKEKRN